MSAWKLNLFLGVLLVLTGVVGIVFGRRDSSRPNFEILPDMVHSVPYDSFAPGPDGRGLPPPVPGTIPRGFIPLHYEATEEDAVRAGEELTNPFSIDDPDVVDRGQFVFGTFCAPCHGRNGMATGAVVMRGFPAPPPLTSETSLQMPDGEMFHAVTYGRRNMPPHAAQVSRDDRWRAIAFIRVLQQEGLQAIDDLEAAPLEPAR